MSIRHLKTLVAIAETGSFAAAAVQVRVTQSAVSMQMKALEAELGVELFDRSRRPPQLNETGKALVPRARQVIADYGRLGDRLRADVQVEGQLRLGSVGSLLTGLLPQALDRLQERYPRLYVELTSGFSDDLIAQVDRGSLDAAMLSDGYRRDAGLRWRPFLREPLVLIAPPDAEQADARALVERYPFIRYRPDVAVGRVIEEAIEAARLAVDERMRLDSLEAIEAMVHQGLGVAIVPERVFAVRTGPALRRLRFGPGVRYRTLGLMERQRNERQDLTDRLYAELIALLGDRGIGPESEAI